MSQPPQSKLKFRLISIQFDYTPFHGCFLCGCIFIFVRLPYFDWKKCNFHHKNAISISGRYYIAIFEKNRKEERKITQNNKNATLPLLRILSPKTERIFCRLVLISVSNLSWFINISLLITQLIPTYYLLKLRSEWSMAKKEFFCSKKLIFPFLQFPSQRKKKNREIKRVLNDFVVTYQKKNIPPTNLAKNSAVVIWCLCFKVIYASSFGHNSFIKKRGKTTFFLSIFCLK